MPTTGIPPNAQVEDTIVMPQYWHDVAVVHDTKRHKYIYVSTSGAIFVVDDKVSSSSSVFE